jgi:isopentenyl-diphosphate delta-isomerase
MEERKRDHINLAFESLVDSKEADTRFCYEPMLAAHPKEEPLPFSFAGKQMNLPIWISSMTGGTSKARAINRNLARACGQFGMGMGLGSCRILLDEPSHFPDFDVRDLIGDDFPLYANLGICQLESLLNENRVQLIDELITDLRADGIIIHVNPLQEAFQPEGDRLNHPPIELIESFLAQTSHRVIVKEVGQGIGPDSLARLLSLPLQAIEFGALGGINFSLLELSRGSMEYRAAMAPFVKVGHTAADMVTLVNRIVHEKGEPVCRELIISGGINSLLDGYYLTNISSLHSVFGMGSAFLKHAMGDYRNLEEYVKGLQKGWHLAGSFLRINHPENEAFHK